MRLAASDPPRGSVRPILPPCAPPIGGYFANKGGDKLTVVPLIKDAQGNRMEFRITMGVRQGDDLWKRQLNDIIRKRQGDIDKVLLEYGVPMIDDDGKSITKPRG